MIGAEQILITFDITLDEIAKDFWARQIPILILKFAAQALESETQQYGETVKTDGGFALRVERYKREYQENVDLLMEKYFLADRDDAWSANFFSLPAKTIF